MGSKTWRPMASRYPNNYEELRLLYNYLQLCGSNHEFCQIRSSLAGWPTAERTKIKGLKAKVMISCDRHTENVNQTKCHCIMHGIYFLLWRHHQHTCVNKIFQEAQNMVIWHFLETSERALFEYDQKIAVLRSSSDSRLLRIPSFRLKSVEQRKCSCQASVLWNSLPISPRHSNSTSALKSALKTHFPPSQ